jgi:hypothetical protein
MAVLSHSVRPHFPCAGAVMVSQVLGPWVEPGLSPQISGPSCLLTDNTQPEEEHQQPGRGRLMTASGRQYGKVKLVS